MVEQKPYMSLFGFVPLLDLSRSVAAARTQHGLRELMFPCLGNILAGCLPAPAGCSSDHFGAAVLQHRLQCLG